MSTQAGFENDYPTAGRFSGTIPEKEEQFIFTRKVLRKSS
jgi:hypothetical protein